MDTKLIIIQIIVVAVGIYLAITENKKNIYLVTFLFNLASFIMYVFNRDRAASISCLILTVRAFIYIYKDSLRIRFGKLSCLIPISFMLLHAVLGGFALENPWQLLSISAPVLTTAYMWWGHNTQDLRAGNFLAYSMWALYEGITGLYIVMVSDIINAAFFAGSFIYNFAKARRNNNVR